MKRVGPNTGGVCERWEERNVSEDDMIGDVSTSEFQIESEVQMTVT